MPKADATLSSISYCRFEPLTTAKPKYTPAMIPTRTAAKASETSRERKRCGASERVPTTIAVMTGILAKIEDWLSVTLPSLLIGCGAARPVCEVRMVPVPGRLAGGHLLPIEQRR